MPLGLMLIDGQEPQTGGPLTFDQQYKKPGGVSLPYLKPRYETDYDVFILRRDPVTGEVYETGGVMPRGGDEIPWTPPMHGPHIIPEPTSEPAPVAKPPVAVDPPPVAVDPGPDGVIHTMAPPQDSAQSLTKPLLIAGAVVLGLFILKD